MILSISHPKSSLFRLSLEQGNRECCTWVRWIPLREENLMGEKAQKKGDSDAKDTVTEAQLRRVHLGVGVGYEGEVSTTVLLRR